MRPGPPLRRPGRFRASGVLITSGSRGLARFLQPHYLGRLGEGSGPPSTFSNCAWSRARARSPCPAATFRHPSAAFERPRSAQAPTDSHPKQGQTRFNTLGDGPVVRICSELGGGPYGRSAEPMAGRPPLRCGARSPDARPTRPIKPNDWKDQREALEIPCPISDLSYSDTRPAFPSCIGGLDSSPGSGAMNPRAWSPIPAPLAPQA